MIHEELELALMEKQNKHKMAVHLPETLEFARGVEKTKGCVKSKGKEGRISLNIRWLNSQ